MAYIDIHDVLTRFDWEQFVLDTVLFQKETKMTDKAFCKVLGISGNTYREMRKGTQLASFSVILKIADALDLRLDSYRRAQ